VGSWPSAREGHSLSILEDGPAVLFGGRDANSNMLADTWQVAGSRGDFSQDYAWLRLTTAVSPPARMRHAACVIAGPSRFVPPMVLFGGEDGAGTPLGDLWRLRFDSAHGTWAWTNLPADSVVGSPPGALSGIAAGYAPAADLVLFVGGRDCRWPAVRCRLGARVAGRPPGVEAAAAALQPASRRTLAACPGRGSRRQDTQ